MLTIANTSDKAQAPDWTIYRERVQGFTRARDVISGETFSLAGWSIEPKQSRVLELLK